MSQIRNIVRNSLYLYIRMLIVLGTSLYTVRVVLAALGVDDYGIYGLAGGMVALFAFLNATMTRAAQRFLGVEIGKDDGSELNKTFNAILMANIAVGLFVALVSMTLGIWLLNYHFKISEQRLFAANIVFYYSVATVLAMILRTPFSALIISRQKMWFFSITSIIEALLKLGVAFLISHTRHDRLTFYAMLMCAVSWSLLGCYVVFCRVKFEESKIAFPRGTARYRALLAFTSWSFIGNLAHVVRTQGVNMLLNVFFGTSLNATYGVMAQAQGAATQFTSSFELALSPQIYKSYGQGDIKNVHSLVIIGSKLNFMLLAMLVGPAIFGVDYLLQLWLGQRLDHLGIFIAWMLLLQLLETASQPLVVAALASGNIKRYQLVTGGTILLNFPLSWLAFKLGGEPISFLYVALGIQLITFGLRIGFMRRMIQLNIPSFLSKAIVPLTMVAAVGAASVWCTEHLLGPPGNFIEWVSGSLLIVIPLALACFFLGFTREERSFFLSKLLKKQLKHQ